MKNSKWISDTRTKLKMALILISSAALLLIANVFEKERVASMDESFLSIYQDRLVPATSIFEIRENLSRKRELLGEMLHFEGVQLPRLKNELDSCNRGIAQLLAAYKKTYFLADETNALQAFEADLQQYDVLERQIVAGVMAGNTQQAQLNFQQDALPHFKTAVLRLSELNHLQSEIGKTMLVDSKKNMAGFLLLSDLETGLIILFMIIAQILIYASKAIFKRNQEPFNMN